MPAQVIRTFDLLPEEAVEELEALGLRVSAAAAAIGHEEDLYADAPDDFLDQLTGELMEDPMTLPKSGVTLDRTSIMRHLLSSQTDPFSRRGWMLIARTVLLHLVCMPCGVAASLNQATCQGMLRMLPGTHSSQRVFAQHREPLRADELLPNPGLKERILAWKREKRSGAEPMMQ